MNNNINRPTPLQFLWQQVQAKAVPIAIIVLLVTLFIALAGFPWIWLVGGAIIIAVLLPTLLKLNVGSVTGGTSPVSTSGTPSSSAGRVDLSRLQGRYLELVQHALATGRSIQGAVDATSDPGQRSVLTNGIRDLPELTNSIYDLAFKAQSVQTGLGGVDPMSRLADEIKGLEAQMNSTNDEFQKSQYYAALDGKLQQMENLTDTTVALRRWDSQIENAVSTLDTLLSQVLRIKSSEVLSYTGATDQLSGSLRQQVDSLRATAEAMNSVYGWKS